MSKLKKYCITYSQTISHDTVVKAKNEQEAMEKFLEVLPDDAVDDIWEVK